MKKLLILFLVILLINPIFALIIDINVKPSFGVGEQVYFDYSFLSPTNQSITYALDVICPNAPQALLERKSLLLVAGQRFDDSYNSFVLDESIDSQSCKATVFILEPFILEKSKTFGLISLFPFDFDLKINKKVFVFGEEINIDYVSDVEDLTLDAKLIYPSDNEKNIHLPLTIKAEDIGTYNLEVTVSKEGYETILLREQFGVIKQEAEISGSFVLEEGTEIKDIDYSTLSSVVSVLVILIAIVLMAILARRKKK